ncbi:hypothetical protein JW906_09905 [bacterium]|nr:hypothetical protein [bacterium]
MSRYREIDVSRVRTGSVGRRKSRVEAASMSRPLETGSPFVSFLDSLPDVLAARDFRELAGRIVLAVQKKRPVLVMAGAHVIKTGLSPVLIDMMENRMIQGIAFNGACAVHDVELAYFGKTSEDVAASLKTGRFGMARETGELLNLTVKQGVLRKQGFGEAIGKRIHEEKPPFGRLSILGNAYRLGIPITVHVALGTDIVHQHPNADGAAIGELSLRDFRIWAELVSGIHNGGVVLLFGSAVILPEVFLKALTVARNVKGPVRNFTTASFDMIRHYRPRVNVVERPNQQDGKGYSFVGHHEIMIPLLAAAVKEGLKRGKRNPVKKRSN